MLLAKPLSFVVLQAAHGTSSTWRNLAPLQRCEIRRLLHLSPPILREKGSGGDPEGEDCGATALLGGT